METRVYHTMDRQKLAWPPGPWQDEPDKEQFEDPTTGFPCLINRNHMGSLCGYIGVDDGHPWYQADYDDVDAEVHGGLTYSAFCQDELDEAHAICHVPGPGEPDKLWWLGFDCAHWQDITPHMLQYPGYPFGDSDMFPSSYKSFEYMLIIGKQVTYFS